MPTIAQVATKQSWSCGSASLPSWILKIKSYKYYCFSLILCTLIVCDRGFSLCMRFIYFHFCSFLTNLAKIDSGMNESKPSFSIFFQLKQEKLIILSIFFILFLLFSSKKIFNRVNWLVLGWVYLLGKLREGEGERKKNSQNYKQKVSSLVYIFIFLSLRLFPCVCSSKFIVKLCLVFQFLSKFHPSFVKDHVQVNSL